VHETAEDLSGLQDLIDRSYATAGEHLLGIHTPERRLSAAQVAERLTGMTLLTLATVTADGRPLAGPVDGIFYRGALHFSSSPTSVRARHVTRRPQVSATHLPGEHLAITVHGRAHRVRLENGLRDTYLEVYEPLMGAGAADFFDPGLFYARIDAERFYAFAMPPADQP
jgi:hypothetical protein